MRMERASDDRSDIDSVASWSCAVVHYVRLDSTRTYMYVVAIAMYSAHV